MTTLLVAGALALGALGLLFTSQVNLGPSLVGLACLAGILARIAQAAPTPSTTSVMLVCASCGHRQRPGPAACEQCGHSLKGRGSTVER